MSYRLIYKHINNKIYETIILPVVLYWFETWSLTLREGYRLKVFENRVLRRTFGSKMDDVTGSWRKVHNEELHNLYSSTPMMKSRMRWPGHVAPVRVETGFWWERTTKKT
jgi:hypothetical protein